MNASARVPLVVTAVLVVGIAIGEQFAVARSTHALFVLGVAAFAGSWLLRRTSRAALAVAGAGLLGVALGGQVARSVAWPDSFDPPRGMSRISGSLLDDPDGHPFASSVLLRTTTIGDTAVHRLVVLRASGRDALRLRSLQAGDHVVVLGVIIALDPDDLFARRAGALASAEDVVIESFRPPVEPHRLAGAVVRRRIERGAQALPAPDEPLLLGFLLGDTRDVDRATIDAFRAAGLTHLLAVSGANVAFVLALIGPLLRRAPTVGRCAIGMSSVLVFAAATRFEPSVMRATSMAAVVMVARLSGRNVSASRALAYAVFVLLVRDPVLVHSLGFRLSVAATAGIVAMSPRIARVLRGPQVVRDALAVTLAAELAVAPMLILEFGSVPLVAPLANLLAVPAAEPLTIYGLLASMVAPSVPPRLGTVMMAPCSWLLAWVRWVAGAAASVPLTIDGRGFVLLVMVGGMWWLLRRRTPVSSASWWRSRGESKL
jgi:competence protein ComEC